MKSRIFLLMLAACSLAGCGTSAQQKADYASVQRSGVSPAVYDKMVQDRSLGVGDVIALTQARVGDDVIVRYIRDHHTVYNLTSRDFERLRRGGVSPSVVDFMVRSGYRGPDSPWGP